MDKRLIDGTADVNQLMPIKYHWAYQAYLEEVAAHWTPEVRMSRQIQCQTIQLHERNFNLALI